MDNLRSWTASWHSPAGQDSEATPYEQAEKVERSQGQHTGPNRNMSPSWNLNLFARPEDGAAGKREALLSSSRQRDSVDTESQLSTDAGTIVADEERTLSRASQARARLISDAIIGLSDGLTVPFALTAGLSALGNTNIVINAGLAELMAGAISMGLGGYLAAKSEEESYAAILSSTHKQISKSAYVTEESIREVFEPYELPASLVDDLTVHLTTSPHLTQFLMHFQHNALEPTPSRAITCALTIACGYFLGGFVPLLPYFLVAKEEVMSALWWSFGVMTLSLFAFGYGKTWFASGSSCLKNVFEGIKMVLVGGVAAACAMALVRSFNSLV